MSVQIGLDPNAFRKLQSCLVAAEAACSSGDLPVVTVDTALAAVLGFATATVTAALPTELAAVVAELPSAKSGAAQPVRHKQIAKHPRIIVPEKKKADQPAGFDLLKQAVKQAVKAMGLFSKLANNVKDSSCPGFTNDRLKFTIWSFVI